MSKSKYSLMLPEELIHACVERGDRDAWLEFVRRCHRVIAGTALRTARRWVRPTRELIEDLVQETFLKLCVNDYRLLREFQSHHPGAIFGYLKSVTTNVAHDYLKGANAQKRGAGQIDQPLGELELASPKEGPGSQTDLDRRVLLNEIDEYLNKCAPGPENEKNRTIFLLHYRQGLSASAIAALPSMGLGTKGVESVILRLRRLVRSRIMGFSEGAESDSPCG